MNKTCKRCGGSGRVKDEDDGTVPALGRTERCPDCTVPQMNKLEADRLERVMPSPIEEAARLAEQAARRAMIRQIRDGLLVNVNAAKAALNQLVSPYGFHGGGIYEDEDRATDIEQFNRSHDTLTARIATYESAWQLVVQAFGKDTVDLAIEEGEQRIGSMPYVSEDE